MGSTCMRSDSSMSRMDFLLKHMGANYSNERIAQCVLKAQMVGTTLYAAVETIEHATGLRTVWGLVTSSEIHAGEICWKACHEEMGPTRACCPKSILDLLTETTSNGALEWRQRCRANLDIDKAVRVAEGEVVVLKDDVKFSGGIRSRTFLKTADRSIWWTLQTEDKPFFPVGEKRDRVRLNIKGLAIEARYPSLEAYVAAMAPRETANPSQEIISPVVTPLAMSGETLSLPLTL